ncbi:MULTISPECIES: DMT family transporter [unclassified Acinetobacter]|uniref:EamA family transporter n=1 Tax=unclassified Acinetobacter TaxID=196816 RepID=UPI0035B945A1
MKTPSQQVAMLCMLGAMLSYQASASFAKYLFVQLDPTSITALRLLFATILIVIFLRSWRIFAQRGSIVWRDVFCYGLALGMMNLTFYHALHRLPQGVAVGLEFIGPLGVAMLSIQQRKDAIWVLCAIVGIVFLMPWSAEHHISWLGVCFALSAGLCWGIYIYFGQRIVQQNLGLHGLSLGLLLATMIFFPIGLWNNAEHVLNTQYWRHALGLAVLATAIPYILDLYALKSLSKLHYGTLTSLSPAVATLMGMLLLREYLSWIQCIAIGCIMVASIGVSWQAGRKKAKKI